MLMNRLDELKIKGWTKLDHAERTEYQALKRGLPTEVTPTPMPAVAASAPLVAVAAPGAPIKDAYKQLPPPIVTALEQIFGDWLKHFDVWQEWKRDFGGYGLFIRVPRQYSTEWHEEQVPIYDNATRTQTGLKTIVKEDIRCKSLRDFADAINWLKKVKEHIITKAYSKGIQLPNTNSPLDETRQTLEDYTKALHT